MFKKFFDRQPQVSADSQLSAAGHKQLRIDQTMAYAADMLTAPAALMQLSQAEARVVVRYMQPRQIPQGVVFIREGDDQNTDFMVLVLDGEVTVETIMVSRVSPLTVTVLGPGSMHGELGLLDGLPRSASCTASTDLSCAVLTRAGMLQLLKDDPRIGAKLMMAMAMRIGERLRDTTVKLKKFVQLTKALQQEVDHLMGR
jgi:CRP/FNR family cyclic AMP-dependent transcriptional regulator